MEHVQALLKTEQYTSPKPLTQICYQYICQNLSIISYRSEDGRRRLRKGLVLPSEICDKLIEYAQHTGLIEENECFFSLFQSLWLTKLKHVSISCCGITDNSIKLLTRHKLVSLELYDCINLTETTIEHINANGENLQSLTFNGNTRVVPVKLKTSEATTINYNNRGYVLNTPNLRFLTATFLKIPMNEYSLLLSRLENLTHLDLSNSCDIGALNVCDKIPNLVTLILYNVRLNVHADAFVDNICRLKKLRHLDISQSNYIFGHFPSPNKLLAKLAEGLPNLVYLDISCTNLAGTGAAERLSRSDGNNPDEKLCDIPGLACRVSNPLQFLGLYGSPYGACKRHDIPAEVISGDADENQILVAARVCMNNKQELLQKVMSDVYHIFQFENCSRMDSALFTVLEAMEKYPAHKHIQISGSATLFYIVKLKKASELPTGVKRRIINTLLVGMTYHKDEESMIRNGCLALCQFRIPKDVLWNYEKVVKVLLYSAKNAEPESFVQRIGIYLLNSLACQVEGKEKRLLGSLGCVKIMLELIEYRVESGLFDDVLEVAWSTMWNMTDETPINCQRFLDEDGMMLFLKCVRRYPHKEELLRNMMGLLGNVAEVSRLRKYFMQERFVTVFANLLRHTSDGIEVSYNAAGILAHMASDGEDAWEVAKPSRAVVLELMAQAIDRWDIKSQRNINYRSFLPLLRLLDIYGTPECQHWAAWALANLTSVYPNKYCNLVQMEGGVEKLFTLVRDPRPYHRIKELAKIVIRNCNNYNSDDDTGSLPALSEVDYDLQG